MVIITPFNLSVGNHSPAVAVVPIDEQQAPTLCRSVCGGCEEGGSPPPLLPPQVGMD